MATWGTHQASALARALASQSREARIVSCAAAN
jgi:hypothetical protein